MRNKLLLIEPFTFLPIKSGGHNRTFQTIRELSKYYDLQTIVFYEDQKALKTTQEYLKTQQVPQKYFPVKSKYIFSFLKFGIPYWFSDWYNRPLINTLKHTQDYDQLKTLIEYTQLLYLVDYLPKKSFKIFTAYDISSVSFWRRLVTEPNLGKKILGFFRWIEIYLFERKYFPRFDLVIAVSKHDATFLKKYFNVKRVEVISNGIDRIHQLPIRKSDGYLNLGFIGPVSHPPNLQARQFLLSNIAPELDRQNLKYRIIIAGDDKSLLQLGVGRPGVKYLGYVDNLEDFYQQIDVLVVPIFAGSGSRIKILESLSFGRPVITTAVGAEGIDVKSPFLKIIPKSGENSPSAWVDTLSQLQAIPPNTPANLAKLNQLLNQNAWEKLFADKSKIFLEWFGVVMETKSFS